MKAEDRLAALADMDLSCAGEEGRDFGAVANLAREAIALLREVQVMRRHSATTGDHPVAAYAARFGNWRARVNRFLDDMMES